MPLSSRIRAIASAVVLVLGSAFLVTAWVSHTDEKERTSWDRVMAMVGEDGLAGLDMARQAFALTYAPLPGVSPPGGPAGPPRSGSLVAGWILRHWDALTPQERGIVGKALGVDTPVRSGLRLVSSQAPSNQVPELGIETCDKRDEVGIRDPRESEKDWAENLPKIREQLETLLGVRLNATVRLCFGDKGSENTLGDTVSQFDAAGALKCRVTILPPGRALLGKDERELIAHELTHCFQARIAAHRKDANGFVDVPVWLREGSANWMAYQIAGPTKNLADWSVKWLEDPLTPLIARSYDAFMFLEHVNDVRGDVQASLKHVLGTTGNDYSTAAFWQLMQPVGDDILDTLPSSWAMQRGRGTPVGGAQPWFLEASGLYEKGPGLDVYAVENDAPGVPVAAKPYGSALLRLSMEADVMMLRTDDAVYGRFGPDPSGDYLIEQALGMIFCTKKGGCKCKDGSQPAVPFTDIDARFGHIAVTGGTAAATVRVFGYSIERFCKEKPKPQRPKPRGQTQGERPVGGDRPAPAIGDGPGGDAGGTGGDPHLNSFDKRFFDLQSVGEYVLSEDDDFVVQVRTAPVKGSTTVSLNVAAAMRVAGAKVGFYLRPDGVVEMRGQGSNVERLEGGSYRVTWPDGTKVWVVPVRDSLTVQIVPSAARKGKLVGVLGDFDGDARNDIRLRDGTVLADPSFADLHGRFVDSWRVTGADSLFEYGPGESTATHTDRAFPSGPVTAQNAPDRAKAEAACREAGVTDPVQLDNCIIDVGVTGDPGYAAGAVAMQRFLARAVKPGETVRDGDTGGSTIESAAANDRFKLDLGGATVFYVADWTGPSLGCDQSFSVNLVGVSHGNFPCANGIVRFQVPDPGRAYEVEIAPNGGKTGRYQFTLVTAKPRVFDVGNSVTGRLDVRGRVDAYKLDTGRDRVTLSETPACEAGLVFELIDLTTNAIELGARPLCGQIPITLPQPSHQYAITVGSAALKTGDYAFTVR